MHCCLDALCLTDYLDAGLQSASTVVLPVFYRLRYWFDMILPQWAAGSHAAFRLFGYVVTPIGWLKHCTLSVALPSR